LISFCEALNLEILNGSREGDAGGWSENEFLLLFNTFN
jgi:hypothetical protein